MVRRMCHLDQKRQRTPISRPESRAKKVRRKQLRQFTATTAPPPSFVQTLTAPVFSLVGCEPNRTRHPSGSSLSQCFATGPGGSCRPRETLVPGRVQGSACIPCGYRHDDDASPLMAHGLGDSAFCIRSDGTRAASKSFGWLHTSPLSWLAAPGQTVIRNTGAHRRASGLAACGSTPARACVPEP
jgi:hypothetical protein